MTSTNDTVSERFETLRSTLTPLQATSLLVFGTAIAFMLVVLQDPLVHDSTHNFRHVAGVVCH